MAAAARFARRSQCDSMRMDEPPSPARSSTIGAIRKKDTKPEMRVRRRLHALGFRFRLHRRDLPGTPDVVLPKHRAVIQVHGCFWHQHPGCRHATKPRTRQDLAAQA